MELMMIQTLLSNILNVRPREAWSDAEWNRLEQRTHHLAVQTPSETAAWDIIVRQARRTLRTYSTSFFMVTRFLPPDKRARVEAIYAAVRYPDEIVDTFALTPEERTARLDRWAEDYETALGARSIKTALAAHAPCFLAGFTQVVRDAGIPSEHYRSFLMAMRQDVTPRVFSTMDDLIDHYVYGSAVVVGYFLTYVYGSNGSHDFERALTSARHLGTALQLTNFLRDVAEDQKRGRLYLPLDLLREEGINELDTMNPGQQAAIHRVIGHMANLAEDHYDQALADLDAFAPDSRTAVQACITVYRQLNTRIIASPFGIQHRERVPFRDKFRGLPTSKYWRLPFAYLSW
ncbi:MAG: phytoene/squalene synthase family protein [candidate division Zixibacteria bacterium]|nr:phytoene/squalene synthase family protein [candidate division Zixibacteria bacterium]